MTSAEWDARFLSAKVSFCLEQSLRSLAMTFAETQKDQHKGSLMNRRHSRKKADDQGLGNASASATRLPTRGNPLRTGDLVHLRGTGGGLTVTDEGYVVMRWAGDTADQKFVYGLRVCWVALRPLQYWAAELSHLHAAKDRGKLGRLHILEQQPWTNAEDYHQKYYKKNGCSVQ
ncbi:hypothetical protein AK812_SmicGene14021 [Symbiodinium microadriaticum]|uniref:Peptide-methionine (S)-S-oxide reductase n=1 Tax=Symbiodinium microadriaticum TaxID=2951 RepID=A0A1Q9E6N5_SYMMI|nr:hypothetical protein AK812_SmicGene14021 [Symbiodinium microadriaticum]